MILGVSVFYFTFVLSEISFHVHSVGPGHASKDLCQHLSQNLDSGPLDSE